MERREIEYLTVAGRDIPAFNAICPQCGVLDLGTTFATATEPWTAMCSRGHEWPIEFETPA